MKTVLVILLISFSSLCEAKNLSNDKVWVFFTEKENPICLDNRYQCHLLPPDASMIEEILSYGADLNTTSHWLNAISITATAEMVERISRLSFVRSISPVLKLTSNEAKQNQFQARDDVPKIVSIDHQMTVYGGTDAQLKYHKIDQVHSLGFDGKGVIVGVMDGGFDVSHEVFEHLRNSNRIIAERDFVDGGNNTKNNVKNSSYHSHGTSVAAIIAGKLENKLIGVAPGVSLVLARTEDDKVEAPIEEDHWIAAIEWMQTLGVNVVNTSLGYNIFTSQPESSYTYKDMNGKTSAIARAATKAASVFNMIVVVSAGNEGNSEWKYITTPADADSIITVGSIGSSGSRVASSSVGPTSDGRIKPDVMARGSCVYSANSSSTNTYTSCLNGTSFAAPHVAGIMALAVQAKPGKSAIWYVEQARKASNRYQNPDNENGYGIIDAKKLIDVIVTSMDDAVEPSLPENIFLSKNYPNPFNPRTIIQYQAPQGWYLNRFEIYDALGRLVHEAKIYNNQASGQFEWDGRSDGKKTLSSGVYFGKLIFSNGYQTHYKMHTMSLLK
jgi:serine protease AprX